MFDFKPGDYEYDEPELQGEEDIILHLSKSEAYLIVHEVLSGIQPIQSFPPIEFQDVTRKILGLLQVASSKNVNEQDSSGAPALMWFEEIGKIEILHYVSLNLQLEIPYATAFTTINSVFVINKSNAKTVEEITFSVVNALSGLNAEQNDTLGQDVFGDKPETVF